nr:copper uptake system-associated protein [Rhizobium leguminosarum]
MFERPDKPLDIAPVVIQADWAIVGWRQDGRGGRALLKKCIMAGASIFAAATA